MKRLLFSILTASFLLSCSAPTAELQTVQGEAQGTTYTILYYDAANRNFKAEFDALLKEVDLSLSAWVPTSSLSIINASEELEVEFDDPNGYFSTMIEASRGVYERSGAAFDPTVAPLVNLWGFGLKNRENVTDQMVADALPLVGFGDDRISLGASDSGESKAILKKADKGIQFDFNAIAQGYSVDLLGDLLAENGVTSFMIELGGEVLTRGKKQDGSSWRIGIDKPEENLANRALQAIVNLDDKAVATSGYYRKFYEIDGVKYSHTIDPSTGRPVTHSLLSATVITEECAYADAWATAFMVMGTEKTKAFLEENKDLGLDVYLIYNDENGAYKTWMSEGLSAIVEELEGN